MLFKYIRHLFEFPRFVRKFQRKKIAYTLIDVEYCPQTREPILFLRCEKENYFIKKHLSVFWDQKAAWDDCSRQDIEKIIELKTTWQLSPEFQLISHYTKNCMTYIVLRNKAGQIFVEELQKTGRKKEFLDKLSPNNAYLLGYLLANEDQAQSLAD
ncbi:MAG: hypothetical protein BGO43_02105 [Gammaproteobacteria bacterium 39-13]|nr:hypothetical protein [Gammaproteobacteria bacterium]OJV87345.1 MAG: hypothetical protein BGO43_02105 [Gammaproteobacteria bacterium 39-13]